MKTRVCLKHLVIVVQELKMEDTQGFKEILRMSYEGFKKLLNFIEQHITLHQINDENIAIAAPERLALTLRFLATGESFKSLSFQFCISSRTISHIFKQVCNAFIKILCQNKQWNFSNALGAIDGKHRIQKPKNVTITSILTKLFYWP